MDKFTRLLNLVALLEGAPRPLSADDIARQLGVYDRGESGRRAFERDKAELLATGVPLRTIGDPTDPSGSTYTIRYGHSTVSDPGFTPAELAALRFAATTMALRDKDLDAITDATDGLRKYGGLGGPRSAATVAEIQIDANITALFEAIVSERTVAFTYADKTRRAFPRQLAHRDGHWYLRCFDLDAQEPRTYRVDRIAERVIPVNQSQDEPGAGSAADAEMSVLRFRPWEFGGGHAVKVTVRLDPPAAALALAADPDLSVVSRDNDAVVVELEVRNPGGLWDWLLGFTDRAELLTPEDMRRRFIELLEDLGAPGGGHGDVEEPA